MKKLVFLSTVLLLAATLVACRGNGYRTHNLNNEENIPEEYNALEIAIKVNDEIEMEGCSVKNYPSSSSNMMNLLTWEVALEAFLLELHPIFTPTESGQAEWSIWYAGGASHFVQYYTFNDDGFLRTVFFVSDPVTGKRVKTAPYLFTHQVEGSGYTINKNYISANFFLYYIDDSGIPLLIIEWHIISDLPPHKGFSVYRYLDGAFMHLPVLVNRFWQEGYYIRPFLFMNDIFAGSEILVIDSTERVLVLGGGGAGGFGSWAYVLHIKDEYIWLEPFFYFRINFGIEQNEFLVYVNESITGPEENFPELSETDVLFFPHEWLQGESALSSVPIPIIPSIRIKPLLSFIELENELTQRIFNQLYQKGLILTE